MVNGVLRSLLSEPRPDDPPKRVWRDLLLVAVVAASVVVEIGVRGDVRWGVVPVALTLVLIGALLWRRTAPGPVVIVTFSALSLHSLALLAGAEVPLPASLSWVVVLPYALLRWGSGREIAAGLLMMLGTVALEVVTEFTGFLDAGVGLLLLLLPAALGAAVRFRAAARSQELEQVRLRERQELARELHDTVAHHMSAIAVQAQAGRTVAASDPGYAVEVLGVIEQAASRTLEEMRAVVGMLRTGEDEADLRPRPGVHDLARLAELDGGPHIELHVAGDVEDLHPTLGATLYRLAQESVTNAVRHARSARRIDVHVTVEPDRLLLTVTDDGEPRVGEPAGPGYGLTGMRERATLHGGTFDAGPSPEGGWCVHAVLPRGGGEP